MPSTNMAAPNHLSLWSQGIQCPLLASGGPAYAWCADTHMQTKHIYKLLFKKKEKRFPCLSLLRTGITGLFCHTQLMMLFFKDHVKRPQWKYKVSREAKMSQVWWAPRMPALERLRQENPKVEVSVDCKERFYFLKTQRKEKGKRGEMGRGEEERGRSTMFRSLCHSLWTDSQVLNSGCSF